MGFEDPIDEFNTVMCTKCGYSECVQRDNFCTNCGAILYNRCTNENCSLSNPKGDGLASHDCYCPECGSPSVFLKEGYIKPSNCREDEQH